MTASLKDFYNWSQDQKSTHLMPALFIGHGSPMNGIADNEFSRQWSILGKEIPKPSAVLVVSAHWLTRGTFITAMEHPKTIHDFGGFPKELFEVQYPAPGNPNLAKAISDLVVSTNIEFDHEWGLDHGTWTVVRHMYPEANIPVLQLSIDYYESPEFHYRLGKELRELRKKGVLVIGSGNMVHNLRMVAWDKLNEPEFGFDWALEMNTLFKTKIGSKDHRDLINYRNLGHAGKLAIPTPDHYFPLLYLLGIQGEKEEVSFFNDKAVGGSLTMTSVRFG
ncbi:4,5-DOPA dioxygenase extradiol [Aquiflexum gelatinilyticum]|uniref:4,5-DOPA dioxygenase extradiol n=1 Tax=Aquiflexum gelatinilyticum TaxID=2961943 RepID=A0A9X2P869_9BACT|nr:4,5-DOPA dioxygenase extradiol [Aquiflexum gelatinilyticum]MCR9015525.1 4,5-DOPA dioxygenase extradiol [Aquiflexum gelatinilyticum]MCS4433057.1 4,5-DOPA dioxygenase extradiol [Aquiflexum gelatinilyticum]